MQNDILVSVIIPLYNAEKTALLAVESVVRQTYERIELIIVDDGSTDNTINMLSRYFNEHPFPHKIICQSNSGVSTARNKGIKNASGQYVVFLDADDYIEKTALEELVDAIEKNHADIAIARSEGFDNETGNTWPIDGALNGMDFDCPVKHAEYCEKLFQSFIGWPWDKLFRKDFIDQTKLTFQPLRTTNDALFVFCALALANAIVCLDSVLFHHRTNNKNSLEGSRAKSWNNALCAIRAIGDLLNESENGKACLNSYYRWILNYSIWTIESLPDGEADAYLNEIEPIIRAIPRSTDLHLDPYENRLMELLDANRAKAISCAITTLRERDNAICEREKLAHTLEAERQQFDSWRNESEKRLADIYASHSYKLGNTLLKPLSKVKDITRR